MVREITTLEQLRNRLQLGDQLLVGAIATGDTISGTLESKGHPGLAGRSAVNSYAASPRGEWIHWTGAGPKARMITTVFSASTVEVATGIVEHRSKVARLNGMLGGAQTMKRRVAGDLGDVKYRAATIAETIVVDD